VQGKHRRSALSTELLAFCTFYAAKRIGSHRRKNRWTWLGTVDYCRARSKSRNGVLNIETLAFCSGGTWGMQGRLSTTGAVLARSGTFSGKQSQQQVAPSGDGTRIAGASIRADAKRNAMIFSSR
jgi:hypothetical protein